LTRRAALAVDNARLYEEAQQALRVREQFLSVASHELNTPITSILGYAQLFQRRVAQDKNFTERDKQTIQTIVKQARRLHQLSLLLLDNSRIETGQLSIIHEQVDLCALLKSVVEEIQLTVHQHTLDLHLPQEPLNVEGDALRLQQVLQNLIQNAVKYSPDGGKITIEVEYQQTQVAIKISDQGIGIPASALPRIFTRFFRAKNVNDWQISGMGLGLYVVHEIVTLHGGRIEVDSVEGEGSTFTVYLPLQAPKDTSQEQETDEQVSQSA
jgi:signal transduction histidine kinase